MEILINSQAWPRRIIVMTLARVGSAAGPDLARIAAVQSAAGARKIYAAGGVRDAADLAALKSVGAAGVLVAIGAARPAADKGRLGGGLTRSDPMLARHRQPPINLRRSAKRGPFSLCAHTRRKCNRKRYRKVLSQVRDRPRH